MYKLLHKLFGWDYIQWQNEADHGIARVIIDISGRVCYWRYKGIRVLDEITDPKKVYWLTCSSHKYFKTRTPQPAIKADVETDCEFCSLWRLQKANFCPACGKYIHTA